MFGSSEQLYHGMNNIKLVDMTRSKVGDELAAVKAEMATLKEENQKLKDALLIVKEQNRKERAEKEV